MTSIRNIKFFIWIINLKLKTMAQKIIVRNGSTVPRKNTYFVKSSTGKTVATHSSGQKVSVRRAERRRGILDCAQIPCPPTFPSDAVCWKCVERPTTTIRWLNFPPARGLARQQLQHRWMRRADPGIEWKNKRISEKPQHQTRAYN